MTGGDFGGDGPNPRGGSGGAQRIRLRSSMRMVATFARQSGWVESLSDEQRSKIMQSMADVIDNPDASIRDRTAVAKALAALERNDIERTRLMFEAEDRDSLAPDEDNADPRFE